ncbi:MAG: hypothetical protein Q4B64_10310 [Spirochaetales bacterium]|nr:hypothetical protein [Spirochaetales bacterium]
MDYWAKYTGPETLDITPGNIYHVIGVIHNEGMEGYLGVIDDTEESYIYAPDYFQRVEKE